MGRALYPNMGYPSPRSSNCLVASPRSPKHFGSSPRSPPYLSPRSHVGPRSPRYLSPLSPGHPTYLSPPTEPHTFLDAKSKDLPYSGNCKMAANSTLFEPCLRLKEQGELLMKFLTGVPGSPLENLASRIHKLDAFSVTAHDHKTQGLKRVQEGKNFLDVNRNKYAKKLPPSLPIFVDVAVDTLDLEEPDEYAESDGEFETLWDAQMEKAQHKLDMEMEKHGGRKPISLEDYLELVKKSAGRIGLQAQLLHELCLGEDVNMGVPDSELPALPPLEKLGTEIKPGESSQSKDQQTKAKPIYRGAMRATSLVIKRLRRMAGLMHIEQQSVDLKEIYDWLQHLGIVATSSGKVGSSRLGSSDGHSSIQSVNGENGEKVDWRLPSSPQQALEMAQADLRDRLAYLFEEQSQIKNRKEQLEAAKRIVGQKMSKKEVSRLSKYLDNLKTLEVGYEELGGRLVQNLDAAKSLETEFKKLSEKDKIDPEGKVKDGGKERKRDKKARKRVKGSPTSGDEGSGKSTGIDKKEKESLDEKKSKDSSEVTDSEQSENERSTRKRSKVEQSTIDGPGWNSTSRATNAESISSETKLLERTGELGMGRKVPHESERVGMKLEQQDTSPSRMVGMKGEAEGSVIKKEVNKEGKGSAIKMEVNKEGKGSVIQDEGKGSIIKKEGGLLDSGARHVDKLKIPREIEKFDKAMQTENSDLLSLMESMIDAMNEEDPGGTESPAEKLKRLLRENKQMRIQLRFWRSRNWLDRSGSQSSSRPLPPSIMMDSSSEEDFSRDPSLYFNPIRPPSQAQFSVRSSTFEEFPPGQLGRGSRRSSDQEGTKYPSLPSASPPNRTNTDILLDTLQKSSNGLFSRNKRSSTGGSTHHSMPTPPILLEPIPKEVLNLALKSKSPSQAPRQLPLKTVPSLNFGSQESFRPSKSLSASSRTPKPSRSLLPLHSVPNTSRVNAQLSPIEQVRDSRGLPALPVSQPTESDAQPTTSPRNARNVSRNPSPKFAQLMANSQQIHDGQAISPSGSPPRSPRRAATQTRRGQGSANAREQPFESGLMIVGRKSTKD